MTKKKSVPPLYVGIIMFSLGLFVATLLNSGKFSDQPLTQQPEQALFELQGTEYFAEDLSNPAINALYNLDKQHFEQKLVVLKRVALHLHLDKLAAKRDVSRATIRQELVPMDVVTDGEVAQFYENNRAQIAKPFFQVKEAIEAALQQDRLRQADEELIDKLEQAGQLIFNVKPPMAPILPLNTAGYPSLGPETAPVVVVDFSDYQCPHCKVASKSLLEMQNRYPNRIRLVAMEFPILGKTSEIAAKTALCAHQQNLYWPLHHALFNHQDELSPDKINTLTEALNLDTGLLEQCIKTSGYNPLLENSVRQAQQLGLTGTPAIFINGKAYEGANLQLSLENAISDALAEWE